MFAASNPGNAKANLNFLFFLLPFLTVAKLCKIIMMLIIPLKMFPTKLKRFSTKKENFTSKRSERYQSVLMCDVIHSLLTHSWLLRCSKPGTTHTVNPCKLMSEVKDSLYKVGISFNEEFCRNDYLGRMRTHFFPVSSGNILVCEAETMLSLGCWINPVSHTILGCEVA